MSRKTFAALLLATTFFVACESDGVPERDPILGPIASPTSPESLVVGLVATMSGPDAWRGEDAFEGAQVGVHQINMALDEGDEAFELVTLDDRGDPRRAAELVQELAASDRTVGIVYAGPSEGLLETDAQNALADSGIPAVLCFGDLYTAGLLRGHVFQVAPPVRWQARSIATYLIGDRRYRTIGAIVDQSLVGRQAVHALRVSFGRANRPPLIGASYGSDEEIRSALQELKSARVEAIVVQGGPEILTKVARALRSEGALYRNTDAARIASARPAIRRRRIRSGSWRPHLIGLAEAGGALDPQVVPAGTAVADTYGRGAHYLPIPSLQSFRSAFTDWWGNPPDGWEQRSFEAVGVIGWVVRRAGSDPFRVDLGALLETLDQRRFGGLSVGFGGHDHTGVDPRTVGLWVVPATGAAPESSRLPANLPWVPLARTFAGAGGETRIPRSDWPYLFAELPKRARGVPEFVEMRYGVTSSRRDPIH